MWVPQSARRPSSPRLPIKGCVLGLLYYVLILNFGAKGEIPDSLSL